MGTAAAVTGRALQGLGGVGKIAGSRSNMRCAIGKIIPPCSLCGRSTPERLDAGLAALAGTGVLDLPEKEAREDAVKISAVLGWLEQHPVWLMILDNVDDRKAAAAVEKLMPKLFGGRVLITGRIGEFFRRRRDACRSMCSTLPTRRNFFSSAPRAAAPGRRTIMPLPKSSPEELGRLALGLEQAGAYIATQRIGIARYLQLWQENRAKVLHWFDRNLMAYDHDVGLAATWATSVEQLTPAGRRLLERLAFFAPEPVPESLLDVAIPSCLRDGLFEPSSGRGNANQTALMLRRRRRRRLEARRPPRADFDAHEALADLFAYSLASRVAAADGQAEAPAFAIHRLVQEFTQQRLEAAKHRQVLEEALGWVNAGFVGDAQDVRSWPALDPLAPHALALAGTPTKLASRNRRRGS